MISCWDVKYRSRRAAGYEWVVAVIIEMPGEATVVERSSLVSINHCGYRGHLHQICPIGKEVVGTLLVYLYPLIVVFIQSPASQLIRTRAVGVERWYSFEGCFFCEIGDRAMSQENETRWVKKIHCWDVLDACLSVGLKAQHDWTDDQHGDGGALLPIALPNTLWSLYLALFRNHGVRRDSTTRAKLDFLGTLWFFDLEHVKILIFKKLFRFKIP
jgi:hypothetical protein